MADPTNPSPADVLAAFNALGEFSLDIPDIAHTHLRVLTSRGLVLAAKMATPEELDEYEAINQELAMRMMGRDQAFK